MDTKSRFYVYFFCDPTRHYVNNGQYTLTYEPYYCGKGTKRRLTTMKRSKPINDKTISLLIKGVTPHITILGPYDEKAAFDLEEYFIDYFKRRDMHEDGVLLNLQNGGISGKSPSETSRKKMQESHLGQVPWNKDKKNCQKAWNKGLLNEKAKGTKFYNNGKIQGMFIPDKQPDNWVLGRLNRPWNKRVRCS